MITCAKSANSYKPIAKTANKVPIQYEDLNINLSRSSKTVSPFHDCPCHPNLPSVAQEKDVMDKSVNIQLGLRMSLKVLLLETLVHKIPTIIAEKIILNEPNNLLRKSRRRFNVFCFVEALTLSFVF